MGGGSVGGAFGRLRRRASTRNRPEKFALVSGLGRKRKRGVDASSGFRVGQAWTVSRLALTYLRAVATGAENANALAAQLASAVLDDEHVRLALAVRDGGAHAHARAVELASPVRDLSGWSFHSLRHLVVTELFRRGASAPVVRQLAGHADLTTTQRYADMGAGDLRAAIALFGHEA
jgi:integrase